VPQSVLTCHRLPRVSCQISCQRRDLVDCPRESMWSTGLLVQIEATCSAQFTPQTAGCWLSKIAVIPLAGRSSAN
jgi:hypothetical protein